MIYVSMSTFQLECLTLLKLAFKEFRRSRILHIVQIEVKNTLDFASSGVTAA